MDKFDKFYCAFATERQLDQNFQTALNADFEAFPIEDYIFIKEFVTTRINESCMCNGGHPV